jgi:AraC-like DNA-binding protein
LIYQEIINCNANNYDIDLKLQGSTFEVLTEKYFIEDCDLSIYLQKLKSLNNFDSLCEEDFILLTEHLANHQRGQKMMLSSIETLNLSTKIELFRRLRLAKSFIFENYQSGIDLESIAEVSCLSKYYLLRSFKEVYKVTPYQAILERRINKAKELLVAGNNINEVAINSGFQNTRSFSRAFKNKVGIPPSLFV